MNRMIACLLGNVATCIARSSAAAAKQEPLTRIAETPLGQYERGFNIIDADEKTNRLFVAAAHNGVILVFALETGKLLATIHDVADPHMLAFVKSRNEIWVSDAKRSCVTVLSAKDYQVRRKISLATNPTVGFYDTRNEIYYIQEAGKNSSLPTSTIDIIPAGASAPAAQVDLDDENPEGMAVDHRRNRLLVNLRTQRQIAVIDLATHRPIDRWAIPGMGRNTPMAIDEANDRLFVAAREPGRLYVIDLKTGHAVSWIDIMSTPDSLNWDPQSKRLFVSGLEGISVYRQATRDTLTLVSEAADPGVKHTFVVPSRGLLFAAAAKVGDTPAALHLYRISKR